MYATDREAGRLTLGVSGMLWEGSLVMVDSETGSLWSHIMGEAMRGPLTGTRLDKIPSALMEWGEWRTSYPETTVVLMPRTAGHYARGFLDADSGLLVGLVTGRTSKSWSLADLRDQSPVNDQAGDLPVLVMMAAESLTVSIFDRRADGKTLNFKFDDGRLVDVETGSEWNSLTGEATSGSAKGTQLKRLPGVISDSAVWSLYYPHETAGK